MFLGAWVPSSQSMFPDTVVSVVWAVRHVGCVVASRPRPVHLSNSAVVAHRNQITAARNFLPTISLIFKLLFIKK